MKKLLFVGLLTGTATALLAGSPEAAKSLQKPALPPPQVYQDTGMKPRAQASGYVYEQKPLAGRPAMMTPEQAQKIVDQFKAAYAKEGSPRFLIYVNRELIDEHSGLKLARRTEHLESTRSSGAGQGGTNPPAQGSGNTVTKSVNDNTYEMDNKGAPSLADRQTVRDVERLFGRPLRLAGASVVDQKTATQLMGDKPLEEFIGSTDTPQARKDRAALQKLADVVIEVLISSRSMTAPTLSGDQTFSVPDIQATAIRLADSKILGQAASSDVTSRVPPAVLRNYDVREISEATALTLMEDMTPDTK